MAGPFDVHITGTRFTLAWDAAAQAVDLTLIDGSVEVQSPLGASQILVKTGQRFRASLIAGTMQLENAEIAQEYLDRYPNGVRAPSAKRLLDTH